MAVMSKCADCKGKGTTPGGARCPNCGGTGIKIKPA